MAFSINKAYLVGNLTVDPKVKYTPNNNAVCTFNLATNRSIKKDDQFEDVATFHRVVVWGKMGEYLEKVAKKGDPIVVEGRIENRSYEDNGVTKYISEIIADVAIPFARKQNSNGGETYQKKSELVEAAEEIFSEPPKKATNKGEDIITDAVQVDDTIPF